MKKSEIISILKTVYKNGVKDPKECAADHWRRTDCILHKYFEHVTGIERNFGWCLGGEKCTEVQKTLGLDSRMNWCPYIHKEVYNLIKSYKSPRNVKI